LKGEKNMPINNSPPLSLTLDDVKAQLDQWRQTRIKGQRIPKHLWQAITDLTKHHSYRQIASHLKINSYSLKIKLQGLYQPVSEPEKNKPGFVEIPLFSVAPEFPNAQSLEHKFLPHQESALEFTRPDGMYLKASGLNHEALCSMIKSFLGL
jgi:hypothetical protein